jgi:hypothetical protein
MFRYFPDNYVWSLSAMIALGHGGMIDEVDQICAPLKEIAGQGDDAGTVAFFESWVAFADRLVAYAEQDVADGHPLSASARYGRATIYYQVAERMQSHDYEPRKVAYAKSKDAFRKYVELGGLPIEFIDIDYEGSTFPALFVPAETPKPDAGWPTVVLLNGLDSFKEWGVFQGWIHELGRRGIATLFVDQPGTGGALRDQGLSAVHDSERWAAKAVDYLETRADVDPKRLGIAGWSLGGYYAPRAAAYEKRFALCAVWGANYNWGELQKRRLQREGENPVPHYWGHVQWVFGKKSLEEFMAFAPSMTLEEANRQISVPYLITHGADDRQIPMEYAELQYETAVSSPDRFFKVFTSEEGSAAHAGADNVSVGANWISDWIADRL